jgi:hypothetical protein
MVAARKDAIRDPHEVPDKSGPSESAKMRGVLRQIEVLMSQGKTPAVACREAGISQQSY